MPTTLLIVKNQGQPSNWSHYRNGSANALHFSAFRISIEAGEFQIEKINAGKLEKVLWSNVTVRDDSSGVPGTPITPTSPIDLANILEGLGYPAYSFTGAQTLQTVTSAGATTTEDITIGALLTLGNGATINDDVGQLEIKHQFGVVMQPDNGTSQVSTAADGTLAFLAAAITINATPAYNGSFVVDTKTITVINGLITEVT